MEKIPFVSFYVAPRATSQDEVSQDVCACARIWETGPIPERPVDIHLARQVGQLRGSPLWKGMAGGQVQKMALERYDVVQWYWGGWICNLLDKSNVLL